MKIERLENSEIAIELVKEGEEFKALKDSIIAKYKNAKVDGFRKGHVPADVLEKTFSNDIRDEILNEVINKGMVEVVQAEKIQPVSELEIVNLDYNNDSVKVNLKVAIFPEFELPQYKGLEIAQEEVSVEDSEVDKELETLVNRSKRFEKTDREVAENGDIAIIDFEGFVDGVAFEGGKAENHRLELGSKSFIDTFEEQIVGHKVGEEFDVNVNFPEQYHSEQLQGKPAVFKIKLNALEVAVLPELNDEFAKASGSDSLEELRQAIKGNLLSNKEERAKADKLNKIVDAIANGVNISAPVSLVEREINSQISRFAQQLQMQGMNLDNYVEMVGTSIENMRNDLRGAAEKSVKIGFALTKLAEAEGIQLSQEEFDEEFARISKMYGFEDPNQLHDELAKSPNGEGFYRQIENQLFFSKINDFLLQNN